MSTLAWHSDPDLKADAVGRMRRHRTSDDFARGYYLATTLTAGQPPRLRGCFHGCLTAEKLAEASGIHLTYLEHEAAHYDWHAATERMWGIPAGLGEVLDDAYERQPETTAADWAVAVTEAIPVGADLSMVLARVVHELLVDEQADPAVIGLYRRWIDDDDFPPAREWRTAYVLDHSCQYTDRSDEDYWAWVAGALLRHIAAAPVPAVDGGAR